MYRCKICSLIVQSEKPVDLGSQMIVLVWFLEQDGRVGGNTSPVIFPTLDVVRAYARHGLLPRLSLLMRCL